MLRYELRFAVTTRSLIEARTKATCARALQHTQLFPPSPIARAKEDRTIGSYDVAVEGSSWVGCIVGGSLKVTGEERHPGIALQPGDSREL
jgi:hypothetical protein